MDAAIFEERFSVNRSEKYQIQQKIGEGAFGEVRFALNSEDGTAVAMKFVRMGGRGGGGGIPRAVFREMEALKQVRQSNTSCCSWEVNLKCYNCVYVLVCS